MIGRNVRNCLVLNNVHSFCTIIQAFCQTTGRKRTQPARSSEIPRRHHRVRLFQEVIAKLTPGEKLLPKKRTLAISTPAILT